MGRKMSREKKINPLAENLRNPLIAPSLVEAYLILH